MTSRFPESWDLVPLEDAIEKLIDYRGKTPKKIDKGIPLVTAKIVKKGEVLPPTEFIAPEDYDSWMTRGFPEVGDVVLTVEAPLGEVAQLKNAHIALAQRIVTLRGKKEYLDNTYLKYALMSPFGQSELRSRESGSTVKGIKQSELKKILLPIPPFQEQLDMAKILHNIDEKIRNNTYMNITLEKIAQRIFKSWFVDFDPAKANAEGVPFDGLSPKIQALFPNEFEESELGMIPKGWAASNIGKEFDVIMGQSPPGSSYNEAGEGTLFFQGRRDFGFRYPSERVFTNAPKRLAKAGDTLLSVRAPVGDVNKALRDCCVGRGVGALRHKSGCESFTYYAAKRLKNIFDSYDGEGTVFGSINQTELKSLDVIAPSQEIMKKFNEIASPIDERLKCNTEQINTLTVIRDKLLPRLISGKITIQKAEKMLEEAS